MSSPFSPATRAAAHAAARAALENVLAAAPTPAAATGAAAYALLLTGAPNPASYASVDEMLDALAHRLVARLAPAAHAD